MKTRNAKFIEENMIDCEIEHPEYGWIPFTARPDDVEPLGKELFKALKAKKSTKALDPQEYKERAGTHVRAHRDAMLISLDAFVSNPLRFASLTDQAKLDLAVYRQALLDVPQQDGFPFSVDWPKTDRF